MSVDRAVSDDEPQFDLLLFREVLASFPTGVVIVTAMDEDQAPAGVTVSAFCSVSANPALVLVCIDKGSRTLAAIQSSRAFTVNVLAAGSEEIAMLFASKHDDKFAAVSWGLPEHEEGGPVLHSDAAAHLVCTVHDEVRAGDHWIFIGRVVEAGVQEVDRHLLYHRRGFSSVG